MAAVLGMRAFFLSAGRTSCGLSFDKNGIFVGDVPLLARARTGGSWSVRPVADLNDELTDCYRIPVDVTAKTGALVLIANALNRGDVALAAIATVQMQFPDPPPLAKQQQSTAEIARRALELFRSGLLKADPDWDAKHPRTGTKPNPGWFALKPAAPKVPSKDPRSVRWPQPRVNQRAREFVRIEAGVLADHKLALFRGIVLDLLIEAFIKTITPVELNRGEELLTAQLKASLQPPKTLEELQEIPTENIDGYELHHIVEQNPDNLKKIDMHKFGQELIDDPRNLVWVPHFAHIEITATYNGVPNDDGVTYRESVSKLDFVQQREVGLSILRRFGVLK